MLYKRTTIFFVTALFIGSSFVSPVLTEETGFTEKCKKAAKKTAFGVAFLYSVLRLGESYDVEPIKDAIDEFLKERVREHGPFIKTENLKKRLGGYAGLADWVAAGAVVYGLGSWAYNYWNNKKDEDNTDQTANNSNYDSSSAKESK